VAAVNPFPLDREYLKTRKLFVATPCFNGICTVQWHNSVMQLNDILAQYGVKRMFATLDRESLIPRGRNRMTCMFEQTDATDMIFLDSDIGFNAGDVVTLLQLSQDYPGIIGAPYAMKEINWERIMREQPLVALAPAVGARLVANWVKPELDLTMPQEVREIGNGFMMFSRDVLIALSPHVKHYDLNAEEKATYKVESIPAYFEAGVDPDSNQYLSEDWFFCRTARKVGIKVWLCPWCITRHVGSYEFVCDLGAMARAGVTDL
jgi:hypothetical protein